MAGYTPLFNEIVTSSIWNENHVIRIVWITLMALADMDGNVYASIAGLAPVARVTIPECEKAIKILSSPDQYSRSQEQEGRRIIFVEGGWHLVNHGKYRQKAKSRAGYMRRYREEKKKKQKEKNTNTNANANRVTRRNIALQNVTVTESIINPTQKECIDVGITAGIPEQQSIKFYEHYKPQGWLWGNGQPMFPPLADCMVRWRNNQYKFDKPEKHRCARSGCADNATHFMGTDDTGQRYFYCGKHFLESEATKKRRSVLPSGLTKNALKSANTKPEPTSNMQNRQLNALKG